MRNHRKKSLAPYENFAAMSKGKSLPHMHPIINYYPCPKFTEVFIDVSIHIVIVLGALTGIFHTKLSEIEHKTLTREFETIMDKLADKTGSETTKLHPCAQKVISLILQTTKAMQRDPTDEHNRNLRMNNFIGIDTIAIVVIIMAISTAAINLRYRHCRAIETDTCHTDEIEWSHILTNNVISLIIVGAFEVYFITNIATNFVPTSESKVRDTIFDRIDEDLRLLDESDDRFVAPPLKETTDTERNMVISFCLAIIVTIACVYILSRMKRNEKYNASLAASSANRSGRVDKWLYDAFSWIWSSEVVHVPQSKSTGLYTLGVCSDRIILPIVGACGMFAGITFTFFDKIAETEQRLNDQQAQRVVDQAMFTLNAGIANVPPAHKKSLVHKLQTELAHVRNTLPEDPSLAKQIHEKNEAVFEKVTKFASLVGTSCVGLVLIGVIFVYIRTHAQKDVVQYMGMSVTTFLLGCTVAFLCEYGFMTLIISNFDGANPAEIIRYFIDKYNAKLSTDCKYSFDLPLNTKD